MKRMQFEFCDLLSLKLNLNACSVFLSAVILASVLSGKSMAAEGTISGVYVGSMHLTDGIVRDVPLALSLIITDETTTTPTGIQYVIDGTFVVDEEGGPYTFTKVQYDLDKNRLDLKYSRPRNDPTTVAPANFRLVGNFGNGNTLSGKVSSGIVGAIGTFNVTLDSAQTSLPVKQKYIGTWSGIARGLAGGGDRIMSISVLPASGQSINPVNFEFEFTPGRYIGYRSGDVGLGRFNFVQIDYLRRKVIATDDGAYITLEFSLDFDKKTLNGNQSSSLHGRTYAFDDWLLQAQ